MTEPVAGAVLAGGASRRFGSDKTQFEFEGRTLLARAVSLLESVGCEPVLIVGGKQQASGSANYVHDLYPGEGPLGGFLSALAATDSDSTMVVACDLPFLSQELMLSLVEHRGTADVVLAQGANGPEPLVGLYRRTVEGPFNEAFAKGVRSMHGALGLVNVSHVIVSDEQQLQNINRVEDL